MSRESSQTLAVSRRYAQPASSAAATLQTATTIQPFAGHALPPSATWLAWTSQ